MYIDVVQNIYFNYKKGIYYEYEQNINDFIDKVNSSELEDLFLIKSEYLTLYLKFIKGNKNIFKAAFSNPDVMQANKRITLLEKHIIISIMRRYNMSEEKIKFILSFYINGIIAVFNESIKNDCKENIEEIESIIIDCIKKL